MTDPRETAPQNAMKQAQTNAAAKNALQMGTGLADPRLPYMMVALTFSGTLVAAVLLAGFFDAMSQ